MDLSFRSSFPSQSRGGGPNGIQIIVEPSIMVLLSLAKAHMSLPLAPLGLLVANALR